MLQLFYVSCLNVWDLPNITGVLSLRITAILTPPWPLIMPLPGVFLGDTNSIEVEVILRTFCKP
jgi:hypothetical protein